MHPPSLAELERRAYRATVDDGLVDILLGSFLLTVGVAMATGLTQLPVVLGVIAVPLWRRLRSTITEPRLGHVRLHPARVAQLQRGRMALKGLIAVVLLGILAILVGGESWRQVVRGWGTPALGGLLGVTVALAGYLFEARRAYAYATGIFLAFLVADWSGAPRGSGAFASAALILLGGSWLVMRTLRIDAPSGPESVR